MLKSYTIACGQGATKAMIKCIDKGILKPEECIIVNSTTKDIPESYRNNSSITKMIISENENAGCGKVRENAKALMQSFLMNKTNEVDGILKKIEDADFIHIMSTTEGASGSGASVVLADFLDQALMYNIGNDNWAKVPIIITAITGWESDMRGVQNTINYFKDIDGKSYTVHVISNKMYNDNGMVYDGETIFSMEDNINEYIAKAVAAIKAHGIIDSSNNIDDTDHFKVITNQGVLFCAEINLKNVTSATNLNTWIDTTFNKALNIEFDPSASKVAVYINIDDSRLDIIDTNFTAIKNKLCRGGIALELFIHRQNNSSMGEFMRIIGSGIDFPTNKIYTMYENLQAASQKSKAEEKVGVGAKKLADLKFDGGVGVTDIERRVSSLSEISIGNNSNENVTTTVTSLNSSKGERKTRREFTFGTTKNTNTAAKETVQNNVTVNETPAKQDNNDQQKNHFGTTKNTKLYSEDGISLKY